MNLRKSLNLLDTVAIPQLVTNQHNNAITVEGLTGFTDALKLLASAPLLRGVIENELGEFINETYINKLRLDQTEWYSLSSKINELTAKLRGIREFLHHLVPQEEEDTIYVKLPDCTDASVIAEQIDSVQKAISQVVLNETISGKVELKRVESGSIWIELALGSTLAVSLLGSIAWAAAVIAKKRKETEIIEQHVRTLEIKNDALQAIQNGHKALIEQLVSTEIEGLLSKYFGGESDAEIRGSILFAIVEFSSLITKGAEVHPALSAPETVENLFPKSIDPLKLVSKVKSLPEYSGNHSIEEP